jgi:uncharacterized protein (TIGR02246 family)
MKLRLNVFAAMALVAPLFACTPADQSSEPATAESLSATEARAISDRLNEEWDAAVVSGDFEAAVAMYTEDAIRMQWDMPALVGREAIRTWMQSEADTYTFEGSNQTLEITVLSPEWILLRSTGTFTATPKAGGEARVQTEKWLTVVQRQPDGTWKWYRDAGSSDFPDRPTPAPQ